MNGQFNRITPNGKENTLLYLPTGYAAKNKYPLIIFLHGSGEAGSNLDAVKTQGLPKVIQDHITKGDIASTDLDKFIIAAQQYPGGPYYSPTPDWTFQLLGFLKDNYNIDEKRVYLTGLSAGGNRIMETIPKYPDLFAAAVPMSTAEWVSDYSKFKDNHLWFFCGMLDNNSWPRENISVPAINKAGGTAILTAYDNGHCCWPTFYEPSWKWAENKTGKDIGEANGLSIYEWLLQYELDTPVTEPPTETFVQSSAIIAGSIKAGGDSIINTTDTSVTLDASASTGSINKWTWGVRGDSPKKKTIIVGQGTNKATFSNLEEGQYLLYVSTEYQGKGWPSSCLMTVNVGEQSEQSTITSVDVFYSDGSKNDYPGEIAKVTINFKDGTIQELK